MRRILPLLLAPVLIALAAGCASVPEWRDCSKASCWDGSNAQRRMMNVLSPAFPDAKFEEYARWMKARGCNTAHVFLINRGDGEGGGYNAATNADHAKLARKRIAALRGKGFAVVPWLVADDSSDYAKDLFAHADERLRAIADAGLLDQASYVVLGLEMNEYGSAADWGRVAAALRKVWPGKVGTHHTSGNSFPYAGLGEIVLGQLDPKKATPAAIAGQIGAIRALGKEAVGFEYQRYPDRARAQAALDAGAFGCGNW